MDSNWQFNFPGDYLDLKQKKSVKYYNQQWSYLEIQNQILQSHPHEKPTVRRSGGPCTNLNHWRLQTKKLQVLSHSYKPRRSLQTTTMPSELITAYRKLLRAGLRAVQFSKPSRFIVRDQLRAGFRDTNNKFEPERVRRTIWFLNAAAQERGLEHKILKNLCRVQFERSRELGKGNWKTKIKLLQDEEAKISKKGAKRSVGKNERGAGRRWLSIRKV